MEQLIRVSISRGVLHLELNRPAKKNALTHAMYQILADAVNDANVDPDVRTILFSGNGNDYCSGNDLRDFLDNPPADETAPVFQFIHALVHAKTPLIAAVNGMAIGIGVTMLLHCDTVYAASDAIFSMPFVRLGVCTEAGASMLLPMLCGHRMATELLLREPPFSAEVAQNAGIVNRVVDKTQLVAAAMAEAHRIAALPATAVQANKRLLKAPVKQELLKVIAEEAAQFIELLGQPESRQAMARIMDGSGGDQATDNG